MTERYVFRMSLNTGMADEYKRRHDEIWPELIELLREAGVSEYSIHLDEASGHLIGVLARTTNHTMDALPEHPLMQKWWAHMSDIMQTNPDNSPIAVSLSPVFYMP